MHLTFFYFSSDVEREARRFRRTSSKGTRVRGRHRRTLEAIDVLLRLVLSILFVGVGFVWRWGEVGGASVRVGILGGGVGGRGGGIGVL